MGHVAVDAELTAARTERVRMLVDTGATYSVLPAYLAKRLGIESRKRKPTRGDAVLLGCCPK